MAAGTKLRPCDCLVSLYCVQGVPCPKPRLENRRDGNPVRDVPAAVGHSGLPAKAMRSISTAVCSAKVIQSASPRRSSARPSAANGANPIPTARRCRCWCFTSTAPEKIFLPGGAKYCSAPKRSCVHNSGVSEGGISSSARCVGSPPGRGVSRIRPGSAAVKARIRSPAVCFCYTEFFFWKLCVIRSAWSRTGINAEISAADKRTSLPLR
jgi:hypothetical protein